jgi:hypothetical protein
VMGILLRYVVQVLLVLLWRKRLLYHGGQGIQYIRVRKHREGIINCRMGRDRGAASAY